MKKEYNKPIIDVKEFDTIENVAALSVNAGALNWETVTKDSVDWE